MFDTFVSRLMVEGTLVTLTPLRIGAQQTTNPVDPDNSVVKDVLGRPVIPGSSLKGALRAHMESILRAIQIQHQPARLLSCDLLGNSPCIDIKALKEAGEQADDYLYDLTCMACRVFGAPWLAAKLAFRDLDVDEEFWAGRYLIRDGVAIDRDKGNAAARLKYDFEAVPAGTRFNFKAQLDNASDAEMGLALLALRALQNQQIQIGGGRSRGLGWCELRDVRFIYYEDPVDLLVGASGRPFGDAEQQLKIDAFLSEAGA